MGKVTLGIPQKPVAGVVAADGWDQFVGAHPAAHLLQTHGWGCLKQQFGWRQEGVALLDDRGQVQAGALLLLRRAAGLTIAYVPKGPLTDWHDRALTTELLHTLVAKSRGLGAAVLKVEPELADTPANRALLTSYGLQPSRQTIQPRSTTMIEISGSEDAILDAMKSKWRYNIRLAKRKEVIVREAVAADLPAFNELMGVTGTRDGFAVHSAAYYAAAYDLLVPHHAVFLLAEYAGQPLAAIVVAAVGKTAWYLWGASSDRERNRMPNHALQWAGIQWARQRGATRYDFWGIPDDIGKVAMGVAGGDGSGTPVDDLPLDLESIPTGELWGVYRFKQGFGGNVVRYVGAWDLPIQPVGYKLYTVGLAAREKVGELKQLRNKVATRQTVSAPTPSLSHFPNLHPIHTPLEWQKTLAALPNPHVLQSWEWGKIKGQTEWVAERFALRTGDNVGAAFQFLSRQPIPGLPLRIGYLPKGPVVDWQDIDLAEATLAQIEAHARARNCIFVKIDPDLRVDTTVGRTMLHTMERRGWRFSDDQIQFQNTAFSDLRGGEEALSEVLKSKWRYNVRLAERRGVQIRQGTASDLPAFYKLYAETGQRDGFLIRPFDYYRTTWETFLTAQAEPANPAGGALLLAEHAEEQEPLAGLFLFRYGQRSWYFYGASSERRRRDMPNYLLQWEALRWSMAQGCTVYDWWGAPTDLADPNDQMQGVWQFKQGFGAVFQSHIGAWDFPVQPALYSAYRELFPVVLDLLRKVMKRG